MKLIVLIIICKYLEFILNQLVASGSVITNLTSTSAQWI